MISSTKAILIGHKRFAIRSVSTRMDRRKYLEGLGAVVATGAVAGCAGNGDAVGSEGGSGDGDSDGETGLLSTSVTDQPNDIADFESLVVTIEGIWVKPADAEDEETEDDDEDSDTDEDVDETDGDEEADGGDENEGDEEDEEEEDDDVEESSGRRYIEFEEPQEADLVGLQGDETQLIDETELETGDYQFLQLNVSGTTGTLEGGEEAPVETPGNAPLQFKHAFEIRAEERTRFIADFAPFRRGNGEYLIRPVASGTRVLYGDEEYEGGSGDDSDDDDDAENDDHNGAGNGGAGGSGQNSGGGS